MLQGVGCCVELQNGFLSKPIEPVKEIECDTSDSIWVQPALDQDRSDDGDGTRSTVSEENFTPELRQCWGSVENNGGLDLNSDTAPNPLNRLDMSRCSESVAPTEKRHSILTVDGVNVLSGSLILSLERTLFSALNNAYTITFVGTGLMMVGASNDSIPDSLGIIIVICGLIFACASWVMHYARLMAFQRGASLDAKFSLVWTFFMTFFLFGAVAIELRYGILYPYLKRSKAVEVV